MNKGILLSFGVMMFAFSGCVSYTGITGETDDMVDEANQSYVAAAQKAFEARMNAPARPVVVMEAPGMSLFLGQTATASHPLCNDLNVRKEVAMMFKSQLRELVGSMKDFKLQEETAPMVSVVAEGEGKVPQNYLLTYNITSLELRENAAGSLTTAIVGSQVGGGAGQKVASQKFWDGIAKVEVRLFKPNGKECIFSFVGAGKYTKMVDQMSPVSKDLLIEAVRAAAADAMASYGIKFGPQMYVTDTCQDGRFVRLSVGSQFGVLPKQRVEFYRNTVRKTATGEEEIARQVVATGLVGVRKAPIEEDGAWVWIQNYGDPWGVLGIFRSKEDIAAKRKAFRWTSARILPIGKK